MSPTAYTSALASKEWETLSPNEVVRMLAEMDAELPVRDEDPSSSLGHSSQDGFGTFNAFMTRSNTMGVYRLEDVDMSKSTSRGVRIRYKVVQSSTDRTSGKDALAWQLALTRDQELDAKTEVARYEVQLSCLGKAETTAGSAGKTSEADRETERLKKDLADAKFEAVSLSEAVRKLEEQVNQPGEPSRVMVAVPLATQLSEALRAETASRKEIVDLESLLLHAEEGPKTQPASTNVQYEVKFAKEELAIARTRQTLWADQVKRLREQTGEPSANATTCVQAFLAAALAGKVDEAAALADGDQLPVEQIRELRDQIKAKKVAVVSVLASETGPRKQALAITESVQVGEPDPDGRNTGKLVIALAKQDDRGWLVQDIDFESEDSVKGELDRFLRDFPDAQPVPEAAAIVPN